MDVETTNDTLAVCSGCAPGALAAVFVVEHLELVAVGAGTSVRALEVVDAAGDFPNRWVGGKLALSVAEADRGEQLNEVADGKRRELRAARGRVRALGWSVVLLWISIFSSCSAECSPHSAEGCLLELAPPRLCESSG